jgi:hypothetical protein
MIWAEERERESVSDCFMDGSCLVYHPETVLEIQALINLCTLPGCDVKGWLVRAGASGRIPWVIDCFEIPFQRSFSWMLYS